LVLRGLLHYLAGEGEALVDPLHLAQQHGAPQHQADAVRVVDRQFLVEHQEALLFVQGGVAGKGGEGLQVVVVAGGQQVLGGWVSGGCSRYSAGAEASIARPARARWKATRRRTSRLAGSTSPHGSARFSTTSFSPTKLAMRMARSITAGSRVSWAWLI